MLRDSTSSILSLVRLGAGTGLLAFFAYYTYTVWVDKKPKARVYRGYLYDVSGKRLPGPYNSWPMGYITEIRKYRSKHIWWTKLMELMKEYDGIAAFHFLNLRSVCVGLPSMARVVLGGSVDDFPKGVLYKTLRLLPGGLLTVGGEEWRRDRRLLHPAFSHDSINKMMPIFNEHAKEFVAELCTKQFEDMTAALCRLTLKIIIHAGFGSRSDLKEGDELSKAASVSLTEISWRLRDSTPFQRYWPPRHLRFVNAENVMKGVIKEVIKERKSGQRTDGDTLIDHMLHAANEGLWDSKKVFAHGMTFLVAGHETTSSMLGWTLLELCQHPEILNRLRDEVDAALASSSTGDVEPHHLEAMPYLRCVLKESLRLHPPVTVISRVNMKDVEIGGYNIPAGWNVAVSIYAIHMNETLWERPTDFWPERWEGPNSPIKHPFQYLPFAMGPRDCIGQRFAMVEASVILARLVQKVNWELQCPVEDIPVYESVTVRPKILPCRIMPR